MISQIKHSKTSTNRFVVSCILLAALSALSLSFLKETCAACDVAASLTPISNLNLYGAGFYAILTIFAMQTRPAFLKWLSFGLFFAAGCHAVLLFVLSITHTACIPCIICAMCIFAAGLFLHKNTSLKAISLATTSGILLCASTWLLQYQSNKALLKESTAKAVKFTQWPTQRHGPIKVSVFALDSCKRCTAYKREMIELAKRRYGNNITIEYPTVPEAIIIPTTVIGGANPTILVGKPTWNELANAIEFSLTSMRSNQLSTNSANGI
ncbi:MAG: hypothetical protein K2X93_17050 [Candidatus Obscuribacterales bacterium]|nr:hypothetical protein [Candidatus Obscuribacterales bacterium]